jgi:hypothetical protein
MGIPCKSVRDLARIETNGVQGSNDLQTKALIAIDKRPRATPGKNQFVVS